VVSEDPVKDSGCNNRLLHVSLNSHIHNHKVNVIVLLALWVVTYVMSGSLSLLVPDVL
jgi:hypothetical protein